MVDGSPLRQFLLHLGPPPGEIHDPQGSLRDSFLQQREKRRTRTSGPDGIARAVFRGEHRQGVCRLAPCILGERTLLDDGDERGNHVGSLLEARMHVRAVVVEEVRQGPSGPLLDRSVFVGQHGGQGLQGAGLHNPLFDLRLGRQVHDERGSAAADLGVLVREQHHRLAGDLRLVDGDLPIGAAAGEVRQSTQGLGVRRRLREECRQCRDRSRLRGVRSDHNVAADQIHESTGRVLLGESWPVLDQGDEGSDGAVLHDHLGILGAVAGQIQKCTGCLRADLGLVRRLQQLTQPGDGVRLDDGHPGLLRHRDVHQGTGGVLLCDVRGAL
mmetsp:Transcript_91320/g.238131  ORF Transcript_91320/g.238131 Transcript_91320/m.238131 type:complete len:328 (+) Transcript_91320:451-1434(+)